MPSSIVFTTHARQRLRERQLSERWVEETIASPHQKRRGKKGGTEFTKVFGPSKVTVIAHLNHDNEWVVASAWVDPPVVGTKDWYRKERYKIYRRSPWWKKILLLVLKQIGIWNF